MACTDCAQRRAQAQGSTVTPLSFAGYSVNESPDSLTTTNLNCDINSLLFRQTGNVIQLIVLNPACTFTWQIQNVTNILPANTPVLTTNLVGTHVVTIMGTVDSIPIVRTTNLTIT